MPFWNNTIPIWSGLHVNYKYMIALLLLFYSKILPQLDLSQSSCRVNRLRLRYTE